MALRFRGAHVRGLHSFFVLLAVITAAAATKGGSPDVEPVICYGDQRMCFSKSKLPSDPQEYYSKMRPTFPAASAQPFAKCCSSCERVPSCSNSRGEEQTFVEKILPFFIREPPRFYLEIGGNTGIHASNTLHLQHCRGWDGLLVEGHPVNFNAMIANRGGVVSVQTAICREHGTVYFSAAAQVVSAIVSADSQSKGTASIEVPCGPLQEYIDLLGVREIGFFSLDVEGAELAVLESIDWAAIKIAVLVVEELSTGADKNLQVREFVARAAGMTVVHRTCWKEKYVCDVFFVNHEFFNMADLKHQIRSSEAVTFDAIDVAANDRKCQAKSP